MPYDYPLKFGKYLLTRRIAVGGMAEVFKAKLVGIKGFEKTLAVKKILPEFNEDDEFVQMFVDEARISSNLHHSNIVQVFDFGRAEGSYYIAMQFVDGANLKNFFQRIMKRRNHFPRNLALYILAEIAKALEYAHTVKIEGEEILNIVHRDISPQNILLSRNGEIKITDFGIAKAAIRLTQTQPGKIQGKFSYMSPEQSTGRRVDRRSDIFSLGIIAFEILSGTKLYSADDTQQRYKMVRNAKIPRLANLVPDLPSQLEDLVMRMLQKDPDERPSSCGEIVSELNNILSNVSKEDLSGELGEMIEELFPREKSDSDSGRRFQAMQESMQAGKVSESTFTEADRATRSVDPPEITAKDDIPKLLKNRWLHLAFALAFLLLTAFGIQRCRYGPSLDAEGDIEDGEEIASVEDGFSPQGESQSGGPVDSDVRAAARAREMEIQSKMQELEDQLREAEVKANEAEREREKAQEELEKVANQPPPPPCPGGMVLIRNGEFLFGSDPDDPSRNELIEVSAANVAIQRYCIDRYEYPNTPGKMPIAGINRKEAQALCAKTGKRLCSQEEWERACKGPTRGGKNRRFPYGNTWTPNACNVEKSESASPKISRSGSHQRCRSPEGVFDMSGNVDEWTSSQGRFAPSNWVIRGGSTSRPSWASRCASVRELNETSQEPDVGFRCCKDAN